MRGSLQDSRPYWLPDTCPRQDIRCHRTRVHVRVTPQERCGIGIHQIVFEVHDVVVVAARSGVDLTSERSAFSIIQMTKDSLLIHVRAAVL